MLGSESEQETMASKVDHMQQMVRMKRVLLDSKLLPETAPVVPPKLNPRDVLGEDTVQDYRLQSLRVQNVYNRLYPGARTVHRQDLAFLDKLSRVQKLTILRDRAWIESAPTVTLEDDETVLKLWNVQLKHYVHMYKETIQHMGTDIDDALSPNLLAFGVSYDETPLLVEGLKFKTRRRGTDFSLLIKYNMDELVVESDTELEGLKDMMKACIQAAVPVDVMIRENLWLLIDQQLSDVLTDLC